LIFKIKLKKINKNLFLIAAGGVLCNINFQGVDYYSNSSSFTGNDTLKNCYLKTDSSSHWGAITNA